MKSLLTAIAICMATTGALAQSHDGHNHGAEHAHGEHQDLGTTTVAGITFQASQLGKLTEAEGIFEVTLAKGSPAPKAVRLWVGNENAEGSVKTKADGAGPEYEMHVELPKPLPATARVWIEIQLEDGKKSKAGFALRK